MITAATNIQTEENMTLTMTRFNANKLMPLFLATMLSFGMIFMNLNEVGSVVASAQPISETVLATTVGAHDGACGILVGLAVGVIAAGVAGATVGIGGAIAISVGIHASAALCAS
jgi:hypothetical protein